MRVRKLALAVGLVSALGGNAALALGLGEIKLNSTLNQPLDAEIKLLQTRGLGEGEIKVRLAGLEDFERAGVDRSYLLSELNFDVDYTGSDPVIRISSRTPIREPFLNFLVETRWPSGRLLREYTLLMDLPAFSGETAQQPVRAAERERQQVRREAPVQRPLEPTRTLPAEAPQPAEPREQQVAEPEVQQPAAEEPVELRRESRTAQVREDGGSRVYGPVSANQTLWEIAVNTRDSRELSVQQTMLAIQRLNPEAFINDNINLLKKGAVLRLPSADEVRALTATEAVAQVAMQNESWRQRAAGEPATGAPLDARAAGGETADAGDVEGRVSLAAPGDNETVLSGSGSGAGDSEALAGELTVAEEELDKSRLEGEELKERISELDEQIDTMERLVEVSNEELEAVQSAAQQSGAETAGETPEETPLPAEATETETAAAAEGETPQPAETTETETAAEPETDDARNRVVAVQTQPEPTLVDRLMENIQLIGIAAAALLAGLIGFFTWRRRREEEEAIRQVEAEMAAERALASAPELGESEDTLDAVETVDTADNFDLDQLDDVDTGDPVAEAEIHLSLGQYRDAENKLLAGLETAPDNAEARLMLLEVYAHQQNIGKFDDHYRQLLSVSDGPVADRAARLRESISDAPPFEAPAMDFSSESLEATQLDDISASYEDDFSSSDFSSSSLSPDFGGEDEGDTSLLDDLTMDLSTDSGDAAGDDDGEFTLDLELDTDPGEGSASEAEAGSSDGEFNLDDLMSGDLDLDSLSADGDSAETEKTADGDDSGGLDFDLDLSPMEDDLGSEEPAQSEGASAKGGDDIDELSLDDLDDFGGELELDGGLDLDSIDLDDVAGDSPDAGFPARDGGDLALAEEDEPQRPAAREPAVEPGGQVDLDDLNFNLESDLDSELNLLEGSDEVSTKLELAQAYLDMGDRDGAKDILSEVVEEGGDEHKRRAKEMLERMV